MSRQRKPLGQVILDQMRKHDKYITEKDVVELIGLTSSRLRPFLPTDENPMMKISHVALFHLVSGVDIEKFLLPKDEEEELLRNDPALANNNKYFTHAHREKIRKFRDETDINIDVYHPGKNPNAEGYDILYLNKVKSLFANASDSIFVTENLLKGNNNDPGQYLEGYRSAHEEIFRAIEEKLENSEFSYQRVFCLSPSTSLHNKSLQLQTNILGNKLSEKGARLKKELEDAFLIECSMETLKHIKKCLLINKRTGHNNIKFSVTPVTRFRHHCVIDNKVLLTEDYIKTRNGVIPDQIIIDRLMNTGHSLVKGILNAMNELAEGAMEVNLLTMSTLRLDKLYKEIDSRIRSRTILLKNYEKMLSQLLTDLNSEVVPAEKLHKNDFIKEIRRIETRLTLDGQALDNQKKNVDFKNKDLALLL